MNVSYQACDDTTCLQPRELELRFDAPIGDVIVPDGIQVYVDRVLKKSKRS
jgi:hypothetical protein